MQKSILCAYFLLQAMFMFAQKNDTLPEFRKYFDEYAVKGSFVLYDLKANKYTFYNPDQFNQEFLPASTFKICNSLIGLETGVIRDENYIIPWDSVSRNNPLWDCDNDLKSAFRNSVVWYYQELARRVGETRMKEWVSSAHYGNENINGGIDYFWLRGELRITPAQQIEFLKKLYENILPFSQRSMDIVKRIMIMEETPRYVLRAKTGWALVKNTGWYVGYVERSDDVFFFATCVQGNDFNMKNFGRSRIEITRKILKVLKITE